MRLLPIFLIFFLHFGAVFCQNENSTYFKDNQERLDYFVLKRKVLKVYPYAKMASDRLAKLNERLYKIKSKRKKKKYTKMLEKFLQEELTAELRKLTRFNN